MNILGKSMEKVNRKDGLILLFCLQSNNLYNYLTICCLNKLI